MCAAKNTFRLVSARSERGSIVLTSTKHVRDWPEIFGGAEILTTAILGRLLHHVAVVPLTGGTTGSASWGPSSRPATRPRPPALRCISHLKSGGHATD